MVPWMRKESVKNLKSGFTTDQIALPSPSARDELIKSRDRTQNLQGRRNGGETRRTGEEEVVGGKAVNSDISLGR